MKYQIEKRLEIGKAFLVNEGLAGVVPMATPDEQMVLTNDIAKNGLIQPVVLYKNKIVDGRCRQKACLTANKAIRAIDLDDSLTEEEVKAYVKAVNTRRNLTRTQKTMVASKESMRPGTTMEKEALSWGVSIALIKNAKWLYKHKPTIAKSLFDGKSIELPNGKVSNKISSIYAYFKAKSEELDEDNEYGWEEDTFITTQTGKNWYYEQLSIIGTGDNTKTKMLIAELANYKFAEGEISE